jgi:hypothetical protein
MPDLWDSTSDEEWRLEWYKREWKEGRFVIDRRNRQVRTVENVELPDMIEE